MVTELTPNAQFAPVLLGAEDVEDAATFFGLDPEVCRARIWDYSARELADRWNAVRPETADEITQFYRDADLYVWELLQWNHSEMRRPCAEALADLARRFPSTSGYRRVLDLGSGVGTDALFLAEAGYEVTLMDLDGPPLRFARHRFARRNLPARFLESRWPLPPLEGPYDVIVCFDVFEHLPDPLAAAKQCVAALRPGGLLLQQATFLDQGTHPCHLHANIARFAGLRWHIWMAGMGLRALTGFVYRKCTPRERVLQRLRFWVWRATGVWPTFVSHRAAAR
jgi:2-polyprenyl-3-methyl-5-hydroxy-6-metoxy-1,4-benzoquinol methylase